jgi:hypothetical protein
MRTMLVSKRVSLLVLHAVDCAVVAGNVVAWPLL